MRADYRVVLDACVLIPMPLADTLLRMAFLHCLDCWGCRSLLSIACMLRCRTNFSVDDWRRAMILSS